MIVFPLTIPLTTGPGSIATAMALSANRPAIIQGALQSSLVSLVAAIAVSITILNAYSYTDSMARLFGREGTYTVTCMSAFLLLCVGVQIMLDRDAGGHPAAPAGSMMRAQRQRTPVAQADERGSYDFSSIVVVALTDCLVARADRRSCRTYLGASPSTGGVGRTGITA